MRELAALLLPFVGAAAILAGCHHMARPQTVPREVFRDRYSYVETEPRVFTVVSWDALALKAAIAEVCGVTPCAVRTLPDLKVVRVELLK